MGREQRGSSGADRNMTDSIQSRNLVCQAHGFTVHLVACAYHRAEMKADAGREFDLAGLRRSFVKPPLHMAGGLRRRIVTGEHADQAIADGLADPTSKGFGGRGEYLNAIADLLVQACAAADVSEQNCETGTFTSQAVDILAAVTYWYCSGAQRQFEYNSLILIAVSRPLWHDEVGAGGVFLRRCWRVTMYRVSNLTIFTHAGIVVALRGVAMKYQLSVLQRGASASSDVRQIGEYRTLEEAVAAAQQQVNALLAELYTSGMVAEALLEGYRAAGRTLYLFRDDEETMNAGSFNHFQFAKVRSAEICAAGQ